jgi:hypothetical protein
MQAGIILSDLLLEPLQASLEVSCQFAAVLHECLEKG